ncbi:MULTISPECIES: Na(+)/H(+) antiporter subunit C [unclassified Streptomyces]|uniref:Na(+)/H(+) antiporter subunit C n=1 Tax=unclassified Streptomyces TaxID=2593676 RepID=UPI002DD9F5D5|nr:MULTISPECIES: Na(+)/H(+) antiporter subunit C [unclassified Streptomyces]WSA95387.1 Na(+)/H(+) antiporter subunit C [Streptomyces sp. NBC_01795]WSB79804.1 Na(+)/H(+) antiporter subunit C [Streptomyces sp. NBC_01775]WSS11989.1 Na(+)/H(+) antiporter subunit C [Streptomyces sp. NBC_01186]WSS40703.1 Na(+)/H(+) antiporter subunit C [Streptomyces sp. NBC_01187]
MTGTLALVVCGGVLFASGTALLLTRPLTRILLGAVLVGNGVNILVLATSGPAGEAALLYPGTDPAKVADPLPQAFILTAIVITLALTAFLVTMAYRSWQLSGSDDVPDDTEDIRVVRRAEHAEERERLRATYRERRHEYRTLAHDEEEREALEHSAYQKLGHARDQYREMRRRARAEARAFRTRQARAEETAEETEGEDDPWQTILGADR